MYELIVVDVNTIIIAEELHCSWTKQGGLHATMNVYPARSSRKREFKRHPVKIEREEVCRCCLHLNTRIKPFVGVLASDA